MLRTITLIVTLILVTPAYAQPPSLTFGMTKGDASSIPLAVLKAAYKKLGVRVIEKPLPAKRSLAEADLGLTDGEVNRIAAIEGKHPNLIRIKVPVDSFDVVVITLGSDIKIDSLDDLYTLKVGIRSGIQFAERAVKKMPYVTRIKDWDILFDMLAMKRLDAIIATPHTWEEQSTRLGQIDLNMHTPPLKSINLYHYLHKRHLDIVPSITSVLEEMQSSSEIEQIHNSLEK